MMPDQIHVADICVIVLGALMMGLGHWCALLETRQCVRTPRECSALGPFLFDGYRAVVVAGAVTICVGAMNLAPAEVSGLVFPVGVSWAWKIGTVYFLGERVRYYRRPQGHPWVRLETQARLMRKKGEA